MGIDKKAYNTAYNEQAYERLFIRVRKGEKAILEEAAAAAGLSLNGYIIAAVNKTYGLDLHTPKIMHPRCPE